MSLSIDRLWLDLPSLKMPASLPVIEARHLAWAGVALVVLALGVVTYVVAADEEGYPRRASAQYTAFLERKMRRMFVWTSGRAVASGQVAAIALLFAAWVVVDLPLWWLFAIVVLALPAWWLEKMRQRRVDAIEAQVDGFLLGMANALKATPSIGDAFRSVAPLLRDPLRQEVGLAVKEMRVGATLDQALGLMASRVGSRPLDAAVSSILVGRQVGGNLPKILETTAMSLREMARLEGVVRTKTAEGKMQLWVLAVFPLIMIFGLNAVSPGYFDPLTESIVGYALVAAAVIFWVSSLVVARKILAVDV